MPKLFQDDKAEVKIEAITHLPPLLITAPPNTEYVHLRRNVKVKISEGLERCSSREGNRCHTVRGTGPRLCRAWTRCHTLDRDTRQGFKLVMTVMQNKC